MAESIWRKNFTTAELFQWAGDFASWYAAEARALASSQALAWLTGGGERNLIVKWRDGAVSLGLDGKAEPAQDTAALIRSLQTTPTRIVLELPHEKFFVRDVEAPVAARTALDRALPRELERKGLFREDEVFSACLVRRHPLDPEKLLVTQAVLRRDIARQAMEAAGLTLADLHRVRAAPNGTALPEIVVSAGAPRSPVFGRLATALFTLGLALVIGSGAVRSWRDWKAGEQLDEDIALATAQAAALRRVASQATVESALLSGLRRERAAMPSLAELLEETTRLLPDSAWLFEWRLYQPKPSEHVLEMGGYARSAADLPVLFDSCPLFSETTLTSPITLDAQEKKERFTLRTKVDRKVRAGGQ